MWNCVGKGWYDNRPIRVYGMNVFDYDANGWREMSNESSGD